MKFKKRSEAPAPSYISESDREEVSWNMLRYASKRSVLITVALVLVSGFIGVKILNRSDDSKAGTVQRVWVLSSQQGFGGDLGWNFVNQGVPVVPSRPLVVATNNVGQNLKIAYPKGAKVDKGLQGCWRFVTPANVRINTVKFRLTSNAAGANQVVIGVQNSNGYQELKTYAGALNGSEALDFGDKDVPPGGLVQVCNRVTDDGNPAKRSTTFGEERYVFVNDYAFFGTETVFVPDTQVEVLGRVTTTAGTPIAGATITTCQAIPVPVTDVNGYFRFYVNKGTFYCARVQSGLDFSQYEPAVAFNNNPGLSTTSSYEHQYAGINCYQICGEPHRSYDRVSDVGVSFTFKPKPAPPVSNCSNNAPNGPSVEAEAAACSGGQVFDNTGTNEPLARGASGGKAVILSANDHYAEYIFRAPSAGRYVPGAVLSNDNRYTGTTTAQFRIGISKAGGTNAISGEQFTGRAAIVGISNFGSYELSRQENGTRVALNLNKDEQAVVRVTFINNGSDGGGDRNLFVDQLKLIRIGDLPTAGGGSSGGGPNTAALVACSPTPSGSATEVIEAESANCSKPPAAAVFSSPVDQVSGAFGGKAVILAKNNSSVVYDFKAPVDGSYYAGARISNDHRFKGERAKFIFVISANGATRQSPEQLSDEPVPGSTQSTYRDARAANQTLGKLKKGTIVSVRIQFVNDVVNGNGDRNLYVDQLKLLQVGSQGGGSGGGGAVDTSRQCVPAANPNVSSAEAESAVCGPDSPRPVVEADSAASAGKRVLLYSGNQYVEYIFKPTVPGIYTAGAIVKSIDYNGSANAKFTLTKSVSGQPAVTTSETRVAPSTGYDRRFITQAANRQYVTAEQILKGATLKVRVTFTNDLYASRTQDRNLLVDQLYIENTQPLAATGTCDGATPGTGRRVEAEKARLNPRSPAPRILSDLNASGQRMVLLYTNNQSVEYDFTIGPCEDGKYVPGVRIRGEEYPKGTAARFNLTIIVNGVATTKQFSAQIPYDMVRYYQSADYKSLKSGDKVTIRVQFINDAHAARLSVSDPYDDRNLEVDELRLLKIPEAEKHDADGSNRQHLVAPPDLKLTGSKNIGNGAVSQVPSNRESPFGTIEGENALRFGLVKPVADTARPPHVVAKLFKNKSSIRHTFMDYPGGQYVIEVEARSEVLPDKVPARIKVTAYVGTSSKPILSGVTTTAGKSTDPTQYARKSFVVKVLESANPGVRQRITVVVEFINDAYKSSTSDRNALIDLIRLRSADGNFVTSPDTKAVSAPSGTFIEAQGEPETATVLGQIYTVEPAITCRIRNILKNCFNNQLLSSDTAASGTNFVNLGNTADTLDYQFTIQDGGVYKAGFSLRSRDYKGSAKAKMTLNGVSQEVTASSSGYQFFTLPAQYLAPNSVNTLKVEFLNDQCGYSIIGVVGDPCDDAHNRNLRVDQIEIAYQQAPGERATGDRPDEVSDPKVHLFYVIPADGADHALDTNGFIEDSVNKSQAFLREQTAGGSLRYDRSGNRYDITFVRLRQPGSAIIDKEFFTVRQELTNRGFDKINRVNAVYYDGPHEAAWCGRGGWNMALTYADCAYGRLTPDPFGGITFIETINMQETIHALGFMQHYFKPAVPASCAPNEGINGATPGHAGLPYDVMSYNLPTLYLDPNHTDYFNHNNPDPSCLDLARSNYLTFD